MNNSEVAAKLRDEHTKIVDVLKGAYKGNGIAGNDWKERLMEARRLFVSHLDHEDETIYNETFFNEKMFGGYGATATKFRDEMKDITVSVENFFKKYATSTNNPEFTADYAALVSALEKRISAEETILFREFENMES